MTPHEERTAPGAGGDGPLHPEPAAESLPCGQSDSSARTGQVESIFSAENQLAELQARVTQREFDLAMQARRKHLRTSVVLFVLTLASTFIVGAGYIPLHYLIGLVSPRYYAFLQITSVPASPEELLVQATLQGLWYSVPLMLILLAHEMGHYVVSIRNRVPATLPYFIPMPLPPMGTMGAVIFQGRGAATRRQMFDIAVWGPIAGLIVTLPLLWIGLWWSAYQPRTPQLGLEFGDPLILKFMSWLILGPEPADSVLVVHPLAFAGWVGIFVTSLNLLPIGQLDGGHILYTLIGRRAHFVAMVLLAVAVGSMIVREDFSYMLLLMLLMLTGPFHPPTRDDRQPLGWWRHVLGWATLAFLIIGFTPQPIVVTGQEHEEKPIPHNELAESITPNWTGTADSLL